MGHPVFVTEIRPQTNEVVIGESQDVFGHEVYAKQLNFMGISDLTEPMEAEAKIRYNHRGAPCRIEKIGEDLVKCTFPQAQRAITPGQALVFYQGDYVLGGGTITI